MTSCAMPEKVEKGGSGKKKTSGYSRLFSSQSGSLEQVTRTLIWCVMYLHGVKYHQTWIYCTCLLPLLVISSCLESSPVASPSWFAFKVRWFRSVPLDIVMQWLSWLLNHSLMLFDEFRFLHLKLIVLLSELVTPHSSQQPSPKTVVICKLNWG